MPVYWKGGNGLKRRISALAICFILIFSLTTAVRGDNASTYVDNITTITSNGACSVSLRVNVHLDTSDPDLTFPLPLGAGNILVNNTSVSATRDGSTLALNLGNLVGNIIGDYTFKIDYTLSGAVEMQEGKMLLTLPLINGFSYPVQSMKFTVNLPGEVTGRPSFVGSYQQSSTESAMQFTVNGSMITGELTSALRDHESLVMTLEVEPETFRGVSTYERTGNPEIIPMAICAGLALVYWLIFLRAWPLVRIRRATPPEGVSAGELGCRLTFAGADLTMMAFSWAQLGYILIHLDDNGRVWLHKRMDMGNERSLFEVKVFRELFGKRRYVDGTGYQYARLCLKYARNIPGERAMCNPASGNTRVFRILNCGVSVFGAICLVMNLTGITLLQVLLSIVLGVFAAVSAWHMQSGMYRLHIRGKIPLILCIAESVVWLVLGFFAGQFWVALAMVASQLLCGLAAAYGGRRSDMGRQNAMQILGLRHYLKTLSADELNRILQNDPEFFYNLAPYALALGVDREFAKAFGKRKFGECPYFVSGLHGRHKASDWAYAMRDAADILDARQRQMQLERYAPIRLRR